LPTGASLSTLEHKESTMANLLPEIADRHARRAFDTRPIPEEVLTRTLEAARLAPSCSNKQPWRFVVCTSGNSLESARSALSSGNYWAKVAPVLIIVTTRDNLDAELSDNRAYAQFDTGMATMNLQLQAVREGLFVHPMAGFDPSSLRSAFSFAPETRVITVVALGYPGDGSNLNEKHASAESADHERKPLGEVVGYNELPADV
jgi:nitroreductase